MNKTSILIVEDESIVAADLAGKLGQLGYQVVGTAAKGEDAVELACRLLPRVVLMDIRLKGSMDGIEAAEAIHSRIDVPVIYLTAHSDATTLARAMGSEPFGYILKPFEERELATTIEMALYKHRSDQQLRKAHDELEQRVRERTQELKELNETLEERVMERTAQLNSANAMLQDSRRAALNMMEDADAARRIAEEISVELRREIVERKRAEEEILRHVDALERFNNASVGRELRMVELKKEINELLTRVGEAPRFPLDFAENGE
jgi:AmiR/NasT family two-component response regulator